MSSKRDFPILIVRDLFFFKRFYVLGFLLFTTVMFSQVGINTASPQATLDVVGDATDTTKPDGIIPPRLTRAQLVAKSAYGLNQTGALVYVTDLSGTTNTSTTNVTAVGMYYFDGSFWQRILSYQPTTHTVSSTANTLTSTVNGVTDTTPLINAVANSSNSNALTTTVNGVTGSAVNLVTSNVLSTSGNAISLSVNGVSSGNTAIANIYNTNGTLTGNRIVSQNANRLSFTSTATSGTSHFTVDGNTFNIDAVNNRIGIGNSTPVARLDTRTSPGNTTDPGEGYIGIGTTTTAANAAGASYALQYSFWWCNRI